MADLEPLARGRFDALPLNDAGMPGDTGPAPAEDADPIIFHHAGRRDGLGTCAEATECPRAPLAAALLFFGKACPSVPG